MPLWLFLEEGNAFLNDKTDAFIFCFFLFCFFFLFPHFLRAVTVICVVDGGAQFVITGAVLKYCSSALSWILAVVTTAQMQSISVTLCTVTASMLVFFVLPNFSEKHFYTACRYTV